MGWVYSTLVWGRGMRTIVLRGKLPRSSLLAGEWAREGKEEELQEEERGKDVNNSQGMQLLFSPLLQPSDAGLSIRNWEEKNSFGQLALAVRIDLLVKGTPEI